MPANALREAVKHIQRLREKHHKNKQPRWIPGGGDNPRHPAVASRQMQGKITEITHPEVLRGIKKRTGRIIK